MPEIARIYEHGVLRIGEQGFSDRHHETLVRECERQKWRYFTPGYRCLHFTGFVGVLQVGKLIIEVLPKTDGAGEDDKEKWQNALLQMLRLSKLVKVTPSNNADVRLRTSPLMELYLNQFLAECDQLQHHGLAKKYRQSEGNLNKVKGRILFRKQVSQNHLHKERIYTAHQVYDRDNLHNRILRRALTIVGDLGASPRLSERAKRLLLPMEEIADERITGKTFERLAYSRTTERYRMAHQLAKLIILNYSPDLRGGNEHVLAMMFEMNELFEKYVLRQMIKAKTRLGRQDLLISGQKRREFWGDRGVRPDIVISQVHTADDSTIVFDTKWKIPKDNRPDDSDLKQMYVYNLHFKGTRGLLVYPRANEAQKNHSAEYKYSLALPDGYKHSCGIYFLDLFDRDGKLRNDVGEELISQISF